MPINLMESWRGVDIEGGESQESGKHPMQIARMECI